MSLEAIQKALNRKFGAGTVMTMKDVETDIQTISTGSLLLDTIIGVGGIPKGRITELFGSESSGKTTIALQTVANAQREGLPCLYIDVEQVLDIDYARALGVSDDPKLLFVAQPICGEDIMEIVEEFCKSGEVGLIVVDSIAAISTRSEMEGEIGDSNMGVKARLIGQFLRRVQKAVRDNNVALLLINQERDTLAITYGSNKVRPGGNAIKYHESLAIGMNRSTRIGKAGEEVGNNVNARITKNKLAPPFRRCVFQIYFGKGVALESELAEVGLHCGLWTKAGNTYSINGEKVATSRGAMTDFIQNLKTDNPELFTKYVNDCRKFVKDNKDVNYVQSEEEGE